MPELGRGAETLLLLECASGRSFVMDRSSHWMASLYTNGQARRALSTGCCARDIHSAPRGSGHRGLTNSLNKAQSSLGCLAGSSGHGVWSERTKPTPWSKPISEPSAFVFRFTWDQIFSQFLMGFLLMRWEKGSFVISGRIKPWQGSDAMAWPKPWCWPASSAPQGSRGGRQRRAEQLIRV